MPLFAQSNYDRKRTIASVMILLACAIVVAFMSAIVQWLGDDVNYRFFITDAIWTSSGDINSFSDLFRSQGNHWMYVNGRAVAHTLVQFFCAMVPKGAFVICNAAVYVAFIWLIARCAGVKRPLRHPMSVATIAVLLPLAFVTKMMPSCQIGFVWMFVLVLLWLRLFFSNRHRGVFVSLMIFMLGFLAGNGQEALTIGVSSALGFWWLYRRGRIGRWRTWWLVAFWCGTLSCCLSPATVGRGTALAVSLSDTLVYMLVAFRMPYLLLAVIGWKCLRRRFSFKKFYRKNALYFNSAIVLLTFNLVIGVYSNRQLFGIELMSMLMLLRMLRGHAFSKMWIAIFGVASVAFCARQIYLAEKVSDQFDEIERLYVESDDGRVYYNRTLASDNIFEREFKIYEDIMGFGARDTYRTVARELLRIHPGKPYMRIRPAIDFVPRNDTVIEYAPHHYYYIFKEMAPSEITFESKPQIWLDNSVRQGTVSDGIIRRVNDSMLWVGLVPYVPFHSLETPVLTR